MAYGRQWFPRRPCSALAKRFHLVQVRRSTPLAEPAPISTVRQPTPATKGPRNRMIAMATDELEPVSQVYFPLLRDRPRGRAAATGSRNPAAPFTAVAGLVRRPPAVGTLGRWTPRQSARNQDPRWPSAQAGGTRSRGSGSRPSSVPSFDANRLGFRHSPAAVQVRHQQHWAGPAISRSARRSARGLA